MTKTKGLKHHWQKENIAAKKRIQKLLKGTESEKEIAAKWYSYLEEQLTFPFFAYIRVSDERPNVTVSVGIKVVRLAPENRCGFRTIWVEGYPTFRGDHPFFFYLADIQSIDADLTSYQAVQDYLYWDGSGYMQNTP